MLIQWREDKPGPFLDESCWLLGGGEGLNPLNLVFTGKHTNGHSFSPLYTVVTTNRHLECVEGSSLDSSCKTTLRSSLWTVKIKTYLYISKTQASVSRKNVVWLIWAYWYLFFFFSVFNNNVKMQKQKKWWLEGSWF